MGLSHHKSYPFPFSHNWMHRLPSLHWHHFASCLLISFSLTHCCVSCASFFFFLWQHVTDMRNILTVVRRPTAPAYTGPHWLALLTALTSLSINEPQPPSEHELHTIGTLTALRDLSVPSLALGPNHLRALAALSSLRRLEVRLFVGRAELLSLARAQLPATHIISKLTGAAALQMSNFLKMISWKSINTLFWTARQNWFYCAWVHTVGDELHGTASLNINCSG